MSVRRALTTNLPGLNTPQFNWNLSRMRVHARKRFTFEQNQVWPCLDNQLDISHAAHLTVQWVVTRTLTADCETTASDLAWAEPFTDIIRLPKRVGVHRSSSSARRVPGVVRFG
jgi:hypothetical protein